MGKDQATPVNLPPVFTSLPITQVAPGGAYRYTPVVLDPSGSPLTFSLDQGPTGMAIDPTSGQVTFLAGTSPSSVPVALRVRDGNGNGAVQSYILTVGSVGGDAVTITSAPPSAAAVVGIPYVWQPQAIDANGQPLTYTLLQAPAGMLINPATGNVAWTPTVGEVGPQTIVLQVTDPVGASAGQSFTLTVQNALPDLPPSFQSTPVLVATLNQPFSYTPAVENVQVGTIEYSLGQAPTGVQIDPTSGAITWTPTSANLGYQAITINAADAAGQTGSQTFFLDVRPPAVTPTVTSTAPTTVTAGTTFRYLLQGSDGPDAVTYSLVQGPPG